METTAVESQEELNRLKTELKWVTYKEPKDNLEYDLRNTILKKCLIPIGCLATTAVLGMGLYQLIIGNQRKQQHFMRYRVLAQGITIAVLGIGGLVDFVLNKRKE